jgi:hypothetical protein
MAVARPAALVSSRHVGIADGKLVPWWIFCPLRWPDMRDPDPPLTSAIFRPLDAVGVALVAMLCLSWGFNQVAVKIALPDIPPLIPDPPVRRSLCTAGPDGAAFRYGSATARWPPASPAACCSALSFC